MRNPARIPFILTALEEIWKANPDLRLGQLIENAVPMNLMYNIEDEALLDRLLEFYSRD